MKKILIGGDSWGCGEWKSVRHEHYGVSHGGLAQYLKEDGFAVTNVSCGGNRNSKSIEQMATELDKADYDHVIWFQTEPLRDLNPCTDFNSLFGSYQELLDHSNTLLNCHYQMLDQLKHQVICIGGCSKLHSDIHNYENLIPLVPSMIELLLPNNTAPMVWQSAWARTIDSTINESLLDQLLANKRLQDQLWNEPIFKPDGMHPNRQGHLVLFNIIKEFLKEKVK
jgi:hypothetical protein